MTETRRHRQAFSLIEVLIASVITLLMMAALAQGFKRLSDSITLGRAKVNLSDRLRSAISVIRDDLEACTLRPSPPVSSLEAAGYFEIYDGPMSDSSAHFASLELSPNTQSNRFGDSDDTLMFTAKATNEPFLGRVPRAIIMLSAGQVPQASDWLDSVTISSEYAEIAYFLLPTPSTDAQQYRLRQLESGATAEVFNPLTGLPILNASELPTTVIGTVPVVSDYASNMGSGTGTPPDLRFPSSYTLYRRVLLIRPDLNQISGGFVHLLGSDMAGGVMQVDPLPAIDATLDDMLRMADAHQRCDLSLRRVWRRSNNSVKQTLVAANSLQDLSQPENRFAHTMVPLGSDRSMPILATTAPYYFASRMIQYAAPFPLEDPPTFNPTFVANAYAGFLRPEFALGKLAVASQTLDTRIGEDILASEVIGFDVKAYDSGALVLQVGVAEDAEIVAPGDLGYWSALGGSSPLVVARGAFVDLGWAWKRRPDFTPNAYSDFSGEISDSASAVSPSLISSGTVKQLLSNASTYLYRYVYQPRFDTWTDTYEVDSYDQRNGLWNGGPEVAGTYTGNGMDGVDNDSDGAIDEPDEKETSPPFNSPLRAVQVTLRLQDRGTGIVQQLSIVHDFVTK